MGNRLVHTPEGVRDIYGLEYRKKLALEEIIHKQMHLFGYQDIQTPTFEYFDVFSKEIGTTPSKELYKFFDKEGDTLALRPDFTPSIARCAAKYFMEETQPLRLCYLGNTFTNTSSLQGKLKEVTQMGAELIGDASAAADAEMVALVIFALKAAGLEDFQISIGDAEYFKGLCREARIDEDNEILLKDYICEKNTFGAARLLSGLPIAEPSRELLLGITDLSGSADILSAAKKTVNNELSGHALERLEKLYKVLCLYGAENYISFDLGMLSNYNYYTGVIFKAYTYGLGDAIVKGGRYDNLLACFGKQAPAIGFMVVIDDLLEALSRQKIPIPHNSRSALVVYEAQYLPQALSYINKLRQDGECAEAVPRDPQKTQGDYIASAGDGFHAAVVWVDASGIRRISL